MQLTITMKIFRFPLGWIFVNISGNTWNKIPIMFSSKKYHLSAKVSQTNGNMNNF